MDSAAVHRPLAEDEKPLKVPPKGRPRSRCPKGRPGEKCPIVKKKDAKRPEMGRTGGFNLTTKTNREYTEIITITDHVNNGDQGAKLGDLTRMRDAGLGIKTLYHDCSCSLAGQAEHLECVEVSKLDVSHSLKQKCPEKWHPAAQERGANNTNAAEQTNARLSEYMNSLASVGRPRYRAWLRHWAVRRNDIMRGGKLKGRRDVNPIRRTSSTNNRWKRI